MLTATTKFQIALPGACQKPGNGYRKETKCC